MEDFFEIATKEIDEAVADDTKLLISHMHGVVNDAYMKGYRRGVKDITIIFGRLSEYDSTELHEIFFGDDYPIAIDANPIAIINRFDLRVINSMLDKHEDENKKE